MDFYQMQAEILPQIHFVDDTVIEPPYIHKKRKAGEYIIYFVKHGEMYLEEDGVPLTLRSGDVCILDKDRTHRGIKTSRCEYYYIHFSHYQFQLVQNHNNEEMMNLLFQERLDALKSDIFTYDKCDNNTIYLPKHWNIPNASIWIKIEGLLQQAIQENYNPLENYKILCACIVQKVFIEIDRCFTTVEREKYLYRLPAFYPKVQEILEYLDREYAGDITSEMLEKKFGGNFDYMNRIFKKVTGETIFQYLTKVRISHAKILMLHTSLRMREVGEKVGFPDEYYFNRVFKKCMGVPPATYAKLVSVENIN